MKNIFLFLFILFLFSCKRLVTTSSQIIDERRVHFDTIHLCDVYRKAFILTNQTEYSPKKIDMRPSKRRVLADFHQVLFRFSDALLMLSKNY